MVADPPRRRRRAVLTAAALAGFVGLAAGCESSVRPPATVDDPVTIHLIASGRHSALVLPRSDGSAVEYGFGEWAWYALNEDAWWRVPAIVFFPRQGTLGRRRLPAVGGGGSGPTSAAGPDGETLTPLRVPRERVEFLLSRLDRAFAAGGTPQPNRRYGIEFVPSEVPFWGFHNCHDETAEWLEELGCDVTWAPTRRALAVDDANTPSR